MTDPLEKIAGKIADTKPPATPGALEQETHASEQASKAIDKNGDTFDPAIHRTGEDGSPKLTGSGKLWLRAGAKSRARSDTGGPPDRSTKIRSTVPDLSGDYKGDPRQDGADAENYRAIAALTVDNELGAFSILMGPQWKADSEERSGMIDAWEAYYRVKGIREVSPGLMLALVHSAFASKRLLDPSADTKKRFQGIRDWGTNVVHRMRNRGEPHGPQSTDRDHGDRKDRTGNTTDSDLSGAGHSIASV